MASSRLQMHASPQGVLNPYHMCTEHMGKCRAPKLHVGKGSTELCNSHSSLPGKRGSAQTSSHQQSLMWRGENIALFCAPAKYTCSYNGISLPHSHGKAARLPHHATIPAPRAVVSLPAAAGTTRHSGDAGLVSQLL